jgi:hypothetical protein
MILRRNLADKALLVMVEKPARCCGPCGQMLTYGRWAWSYLPNPVDGNYVECGPCRYGFPADMNDHGDAVRLGCVAE